MAAKLAVIANSPADYERFRLSPTSIEPWEDGARTDDSAGTYEWWYFDAHLADGAKLVVTFMNKDIAEPQKPLAPLLRLDLDLPDGRHFEKTVHYSPSEWSAAKDHADVRLGENRFVGDLHQYQIQATAEEISVDVTLTGEVPPWRPATGYLLFGADRSLEFGWLPSVPEGAASVTYTVNGERHETTGIGYHDHNWGNVSLLKIVHDWYWARGQAGPYSVIASYITSAKKYGFEPLPIFMLARDSVIIGDDPNEVTFQPEGVYTDRTTGKPVAATTRYTYGAGEERYEVSFTRTHDLSASRMVDGIKGVKRIAAKLAHFDGAYLRFAGDIEISRSQGSELIETYKDDAIWELMYFGHARAQ
ncbi:MAG TPA: lipocalin-like domain-containing protein [Acidimicrobiales bacterium]|nr:lipocalin-like domain-containing protein [Acidimicrobiales bacterium]